MEVNLLEDKFLFGKSEGCESICSGSGVRFYTDNQQIKVIIRLAGYKIVPQHIGCSLVNGFYYAISDAADQRLICHDVMLLKNVAQEFVLFKNPRYKKVLCEIYFPILNTIEGMVLETEREIEAIEKRKGKMVFLGGTLTYGVGTTSANFMFSNIVLHELKLDGYNFSEYSRDYLSLSKLGEVALSNPKYVVSESGCKGMSVEYIEKNLYDYLETIIVGNKGIHLYVFEEDSFFLTEEKRKRKNVVKNILREFQNKYPVQILSLDEAFKNKDIDLYTYSSNFYNDYANIEIARYCIPILKTWCDGEQ